MNFFSAFHNPPQRNASLHSKEAASGFESWRRAVPPPCSLSPQGDSEHGAGVRGKAMMTLMTRQARPQSQRLLREKDETWHLHETWHLLPATIRRAKGVQDETLHLHPGTIRRPSNAAAAMLNAGSGLNIVLAMVGPMSRRPCANCLMTSSQEALIFWSVLTIRTRAPFSMGIAVRSSIRTAASGPVVWWSKNTDCQSQPFCAGMRTRGHNTTSNIHVWWKWMRLMCTCLTMVPKREVLIRCGWLWRVGTPASTAGPGQKSRNGSRTTQFRLQQGT